MKITKKKIAWGIVLLILIAGGVICKIRGKSGSTISLKYAMC